MDSLRTDKVSTVLGLGDCNMPPEGNRHNTSFTGCRNLGDFLQMVKTTVKILTNTSETITLFRGGSQG